MRLWLSPHLAYLKKTLCMLGLEARIWQKGAPVWAPGDRLVHPVRYPLPVQGAAAVILK